MRYKYNIKKKNPIIKYFFKIIGLFVIVTVTIVLYDLYDNIQINNDNSKNIITDTVQANEKDTNNEMYEIIENVSKSVVGITKLKNSNINFFELNATETYNLGTGVIVSNQGYILSNYHITGNKYSKCYINAEDGGEYEAEVKWADEDLDLSILKINTLREMKYATLGDSDLARVGQNVYAIGNPLGTEFQRTVTSGIISALNRTIKIEEETKTYMEDLIQTDTAINSGNSGGPLINEEGEVVGIATVKISDAEGIGFAVPINIIKPIIESFETKGEFEEINLGISVYDKEAIKYLDSKIDIEKGIYIAEITSNSLAKKAGLQIGDIITQIDEVEVNKINDLKSQLYTKQKGDEIKLKIIRNKKEDEITINTR